MGIGDDEVSIIGEENDNKLSIFQTSDVHRCVQTSMVLTEGHRAAFPGLREENGEQPKPAY